MLNRILHTVTRIMIKRSVSLLIDTNVYKCFAPMFYKKLFVHSLLIHP